MIGKWEAQTFMDTIDSEQSLQFTTFRSKYSKMDQVKFVEVKKLNAFEMSKKLPLTSSDGLLSKPVIYIIKN